MRRHVRAALAVACLAAWWAPSASAQTSPNLLANPGADLGTEHWQTEGPAQVASARGNPRFTAHWGGAFSQIVRLPDDAGGRFVVLTALATAERLDEYAGITDRPYLHGLVFSAEGRVLAVLQGQGMSPGAAGPHRGGTIRLSGIFSIPSGATRMRVRLGTASRRASPFDGSEVTFDDAGVYVVDSPKEAATLLGQLPSSAPDASGWTVGPVSGAVVTVMVRDLAAMRHWYQDRLDFVEVDADATSVRLEANGVFVVLRQRTANDRASIAAASLALRVADLPGLLARLHFRGLVVVEDTEWSAVGGERAYVTRDPEGHALRFVGAVR